MDDNTKGKAKESIAIIITNYNTPLQYKPRLKAEAIIITANMRLLERIYYNIAKATSVNKK